MRFARGFVSGAVVFAIVSAGTAFAQGPRGGMGGIVMLAGAPPIHKELGLEPAAGEEIRGLLAEYGQAMMQEMEEAGLGFAALQGLQELGEEERAAKMKEITAKRVEISRKLNEKYVPKLKEQLKPEQFDRLQQIYWQAAGSTALTEDDLSSKLELSKEQKEKLGKLTEEYGEKQQALFGEAFRGGGDFQKVFARVRELNKERDAKAAEILTEQQRDRYKELKGKTYDLTQLTPGPGFGRQPGSQPRPRGPARDEKRNESKKDKP